MKPRAISYIRFSSKAQGSADRDSLRRQESLFDEFVKEYDLEVLDNLKVRDLGVSGYTGANLERGLKDIMDYIEQGIIRPGDYLCIESLDRLSRANVWTSMSVLSKIVTSGVKVATLSHSEKRVYDHDSSNVVFELMFGVITLTRANEESALKAKRLQASWSQKRLKASTVPMTGRCPGWLILNKETQAFEIIEHRAEVIKRIYQLSDEGVGTGSIAKIFNGEKLPTFSSRARVWSKSYIDKILSNKAVLGEYQPHRSTYLRDENGIMKHHRIKEGEPLENYFPQIIDPSLFDQVQAKRKQRTVKFAGRKGDTFSNLLTGVAKCAYCGSTMNMVNKGTPPKGYRYLVCYTAQHGGDCFRKMWRYDEIEHILINFIPNIPLSDLVINDDSQRKYLDDKRRSLTNRKYELENKSSNLIQSVTALQGRVSSAINDELVRCEDEQKILNEKIKDLDHEINLINSRESSAEERKRQIDTVIHMLSIATDSEKLELRSKLHSKIRDLSKSIRFYPAGLNPNKNLKTKLKFFLLQFKNGNVTYLLKKKDLIVKFDIELDSTPGYEKFNVVEPEALSGKELFNVRITPIKPSNLSQENLDILKYEIEADISNCSIEPFKQKPDDKAKAIERFIKKIKAH